jgi:5,10-methylenetetrahydrofolate reductase
VNQDADYISVAYNPGKAVRMNSALMACWLKNVAGKDVVFNLATRDMNKLSIQSHLLGARLMGLENVLVVAGDPFDERDLSLASEVKDFTPTTLIKSITAMNQGIDFKGSKLSGPTDICVGAAVDLSRDLKWEAKLTHRKVLSGAHFLISQPIFHLEQINNFLRVYRAVNGTELTAPVFWGIYITQQDAIMFGDLPEDMKRDVEEGRSGLEIALELFAKLRAAGFHTIYLMPPIFKNGARNYAASQELVTAARRL